MPSHRNAKRCSKHQSERTKMKQREAQIRYSYGLTQDEVVALDLTHCEICGAIPGGTHGPMAIDHNHVTGKKRGVVCYGCNSILAGAHNDPKTADNPEWLRYRASSLEAEAQLRRKCAAYLERYHTP